MNLKEYAKKINEIAEMYPEATAIFSHNEETDQCEPINFDPTEGCFIKEDNHIIGELITKDSEDWCDEEHTVNAVCVN